MRASLLCAVCTAFLLMPAGSPVRGQPVARKGADRAAEKSVPEKPAVPAAAPVVGCPSLANFRLLMRGGASAAATVLADPKAEHLGCAALPRGRITGVADRVAFGGQSYDCASVQGTSACHWIEAGTAPGPEPAQRR